MIARALADEFRERGIRSDAICLGFIAKAYGPCEPETLGRYGIDVSQQAIAAARGRLCQPSEIAAVALFLASDDASFVNRAHLFAHHAYTSI